ncbi:MAG: 30S ribosomal protein S3 [Legionellales bacterium]|nr:30S ribosomal protein S3 [Legionellales bacterium]OUX64315.1 MAG: 30S ribosomal protein S3 [Gammaproteobacteria bacterium TMED281]
MGQKVNPILFRLGVESGTATKNAFDRRKPSAIWYAEGNYASNLKQDLDLRKYINSEYKQANINRVDISRPSSENAVVTIYCARPGIIIGKRGADVSILKEKISKILNASIQVNVEEIKKPDLSAKIVAESVAHQLEKRASFRRVIKRTAQNTMRAGAQGIKILVSGRLGGAEIARSEDIRDGRVPLHTLRANIDYSTARAATTYGIIGVKVWIYTGNAEQEKKG